MLEIIVVLVVLLVLVPMIPDPTVRRIAQVVLSIVILVWLLQVVGLWHGGPLFRPLK